MKRLSEQHGERVAILAMAVTQDEELVRKQHQTLKLSFPILDGNGMRLTFGADQTPRPRRSLTLTAALSAWPRPAGGWRRRLKSKDAAPVLFGKK